MGVWPACLRWQACEGCLGYRPQTTDLRYVKTMWMHLVMMPILHVHLCLCILNLACVPLTPCHGLSVSCVQTRCMPTSVPSSPPPRRTCPSPEPNRHTPGLRSEDDSRVLGARATIRETVWRRKTKVLQGTSTVCARVM